MIIMAVDLGKARTGIAICDKLEMLSSPLTQISEYNRERLLEKISNLAKEKKAELIVVGLPKNMDGSEGDSAKGDQECGGGEETYRKAHYHNEDRASCNSSFLSVFREPWLRGDLSGCG